uniref:Uncharacterized protein n=1 Tax=Anguilla anguilla TaxID=7936 RepID=A0A0E9VY98_ANGAN
MSVKNNVQKAHYDCVVIWITNVYIAECTL